MFLNDAEHAKIVANILGLTVKYCKYSLRYQILSKVSEIPTNGENCDTFLIAYRVWPHACSIRCQECCQVLKITTYHNKDKKEAWTKFEGHYRYLLINPTT